MIQAHVKKINKKRGFTIAEIMVSVAIFAIIMVTGMGALVNMTQKLRISQYQKKAIDSLSFVLESMTREIRLGTKYQFQPNLNGSDNGTVRNGQDTFTGNPDEGIIGFESSDGRGYMIYYLLEGEI
ncbi:MAG: PulJ/GspJ family protein, partial [Minisyncoccia bacterium]